uniref:Zinc finger PHD-type domain-containing protein n=1 Tax=Ditylum brightwellii TaxID=49249 RepID=A0A6V2D2G5_9STRA|mmetsp:Transcript_15414/g.20461  ORF Transcript_15414/g.20461 Transcript_15414/m.20461 type:complete len:708 (-) Transcript_15414:610-2733(-)
MNPGTSEKTPNRMNLPAPQKKAEGTKEKDESSSGAGESTLPSKKIKGRCDICEKKDGYKGFNLQKCSTCGVCVHESCYGLIATSKKLKKWQCLACAAVGTEIVISRKGETRRAMVQEKRPAECALCSVDTGIHAMHPLYDDEGENGRHMVLPADKKRELDKRLAWVHSLCAFFLGTNTNSSGIVYGCDKDGYFESDEQEEDDENDNSDDGEEHGEKDASDDEAELEDDVISLVSSTSEESSDSTRRKAIAKKRRNSAKGSDEEEKNGDESHSLSDSDSSGPSYDENDDSDDGTIPEAIHHFVIAQKEKGKHTQLSKLAQEFRDHCKCYICGKNDKRSLRIATQCTAGDKNEPAKFKDRHKNLGKPCTKAMHVGCARWGLNSKVKASFQLQHVFSYPGLLGDGPDSDPIFCAYCRQHGKNIHQNKPRKDPKPKSQSSTFDQSKAKIQSSSRGFVERAAVPDLQRRNGVIKRPSTTTKKRKSDDNVASSDAKRRRRSNEDLARPDLVRRRSSNDSVSLNGSVTNRRSSRNDSISSSLNEEEFLKDILSRYQNETADKPPSRNDTNQNQDNDLLMEVSNDLLDKIKSAKAEGQVNLLNVTDNYKEHLKKRLNYPKDEFKKFWKSVQVIVKGEVYKRPEPIANNIAKESCMQKDANDGNKQVNNTHAQTNEVSESSDSHQNPWSELWLPNHTLQKFDFGGWDTYEVLGADF